MLTIRLVKVKRARAIAPEENCPLTIKFPPKNNCKKYYEWTEESYALSTSAINKDHSTKCCFSKLQIRSKKWFTSIYLLQILAKPCRTPLTREFTKYLLIFFRQNAKKIHFFGKIDSEKIQKNFIVNNNNKMIRVWYLSSKWPVCRSIVNQTNGGTRRT